MNAAIMDAAIMQRIGAAVGALEQRMDKVEKLLVPTVQSFRALLPQVEELAKRIEAVNTLVLPINEQAAHAQLHVEMATKLTDVLADVAKIKEMLVVIAICVEVMRSETVS